MVELPFSLPDFDTSSVIHIHDESSLHVPVQAAIQDLVGEREAGTHHTKDVSAFENASQMPPGLHFPPCRTCVSNVDRMPAVTPFPPGMHFPPSRPCVSNVDRMPAVIHFPLSRTCVSNVDRMPAVMHFPPCRTCVSPVDRMPYQPIGNCDTYSVANRRRMFQRGNAFNQPIGVCDTSSVTIMGGEFRDNAFNQPIGNLDTSRVTNMSSHVIAGEVSDETPSRAVTGCEVDVDCLPYVPSFPFAPDAPSDETSFGVDVLAHANDLDGTATVNGTLSKDNTAVERLGLLCGVFSWARQLQTEFGAPEGHFVASTAFSGIGCPELAAQSLGYEKLKVSII